MVAAAERKSVRDNDGDVGGGKRTEAAAGATSFVHPSQNPRTLISEALRSRPGHSGAGDAWAVDLAGAIGRSRQSDVAVGPPGAWAAWQVSSGDAKFIPRLLFFFWAQVKEIRDSEIRRLRGQWIKFKAVAFILGSSLSVGLHTMHVGRNQAI